MGEAYISHKHIQDKIEESHDTLLCTREQKNHLVSGMLERNVENHATRTRITKIYGVSIEIHEWVEQPTLCNKSEVLPLAESYQSGEREPKVI